MSASCASNSSKKSESGIDAFKSEPFTPYKPVTRTLKLNVIDYKGADAGDTIPRWLNAYLSGGIKSVEALSVYKDYYCFVLEESNKNLRLIRQREALLNVRREYPKMALYRIFERFTSTLNVSPDVLYGSAFDNLIESASSARWTPPESSATFWLYLRFLYEGDSERMQHEDTYTLYTLALVKKADFRRDFYLLLDDIVFDKADSRAQVSAFQDACDDFFDEF